MELYRLTAAELSRMIRNKEVSSTEVTKSVFSRIKEKENEIEAYVTLNEEGALKKAADVDEKSPVARTFPVWLASRSA